MKLVAVLMVALALRAGAQSPSATESVIDVKDLQSCGLITRFPGDVIAPNCFQQSSNILSDRTGVPTRRLGYSLYNATPCPGGQPVRGMWPFYADSGVQYLVLLSSNSMFYSPSDGTCNYIPGLQGTVSGTATMECVQSGASALPNITGAALFCTDGVDQVFATNISSVQPITQAPTGYHIGTFRNRVVISGLPGTGSNGSGSQFYMSGELNGTDYTIPPVQLSTSPAIISVNGVNDGQIVTCLLGEFQNQFLVGRPYDLWGLSGYDLTDFTLRKISDQVGCLEPRSVQEVTNVLYWLSHRGVEGFTGTQINRVSYPIDANIIPIIASAGNTVTDSIAGQAQWQAGNLTASGAGAPTSATIAPGSLVVSTWGVNFNTAAQWMTGTLTGGVVINGNTLTVSSFSGTDNTQANFSAFASSSNVAFTAAPSVILLSTNTQPDPNITYPPFNPATWSPVGTANYLISQGFCPAYAHAWSLIDASGFQYQNSVIAVYQGATLVASQNLGTGSCGLTTFTSAVLTSGGATFGSALTVKFTTDDGTASVQSPSFTWLGNSITYAASIASAMLVYQVNSIGFPASGSYTSRTFNTGIGAPSWGIFQANFQAPAGSGASFQLEASPDGVSWSAPVSVTTGNMISGLPNQQYVRYLTSLFHVSNDTSPTITSVSINSASSGTFISPVFDTGLSTPTWGPITASLTEGSPTDLLFNVSVATSATGVFDPPISSTNGFKLVNAAKRFIRVVVPFTVSYATNTPVLSGLALQAATTAYYITSCVQVSTPVAYGNFLVNAVTNGGSFSFWISTGGTCGSAINPNTTWNPQNPNAIISVTTNTAYIGARVLFSLDSATETPTLNSLTFTFSQTGSRPPTASAQWDDRYLLFYTTNTSLGAFNDHVFVYDQNQKWQLWDDDYAASATLLNNILYTGDSRATGSVYQQDLGQTDNGAPFTMAFQTADFDGGDPNMNKEFSRAYLMFGAPNNNNGSATLSCAYALDGSTSTYSLSPVILSQSPTQNGYFVAKLAFNASQPVTGHWLNLTCNYSGSVGPVAVHRIRLVYTNRGWD